MRTLASLILAAGLATAAQAQTPPPETAPAALADPAPAAAPTTPVEATPAAPAVAAPAAPAAPPPSLPTTGDGAAVLSLLDTICVPGVRGGDIDKLALANGFKKDRKSGGFIKPLGADKAYVVVLEAKSSANPNVCQAEVRYAIGQDAPIVDALNVWAFLHDPELVLQANYVNVDADGVKRVRKSWESLTTTKSIAVNFSVQRNPDDTPLNPKYDSARLFYQERTF